MKKDKIRNILMKKLSANEVYVYNDGKYFEIVVVSECFLGKSRVKKQKMVYEPLIKFIENNYIHALSVKTYTPLEWKGNCFS
ncbi:Uncharacterized protein YrbA [Candidatus Westeberhardia cardiocondylae]|uniref:Uncharacterized protein YrbA n=1 Tax=Candidatus Westeberhardia cardiocondylae TaxID=1594731 RepID=A0A0H5BWG0_9ENTR|nr:BolA family protein [Candidatus Westeberhardia cardiocondylae]CEN32015.1 Uncharacterized protein YrbA [Candidatus Westeberhardia cardiocondylae]